MRLFTIIAWITASTVLANLASASELLEVEYHLRENKTGDSTSEKTLHREFEGSQAQAAASIGVGKDYIIDRFALNFKDKPDGVDLRYQVQSEGQPVPDLDNPNNWAANGRMVGKTGARIVGVAFKLGGANARDYDIYFSGITRHGIVEGTRGEWLRMDGSPFYVISIVIVSKAEVQAIRGLPKETRQSVIHTMLYECSVGFAKGDVPSTTTLLTCTGFAVGLYYGGVEGAVAGALLGYEVGKMIEDLGSNDAASMQHIHRAFTSIGTGDVWEKAGAEVEKLLEGAAKYHGDGDAVFETFTRGGASIDDVLNQIAPDKKKAERLIRSIPPLF